VITADPPETKEVFRQLRYLTPPEHVLPQVMTDAAERIGEALWGQT